MKMKVYLAVLFSIFMTNSLCFAKEGKIRYLWSGIVNPPKCHQIIFNDGYNGIYYDFTVGTKKPEQDTIIFFFTGSDGESLRYYLKPYFKDLNLNATVYALQKRNIGNWSIKKSNGFDQNNYLEKWIDDDTFFIKHILNTLKTHPKKIVSFGVSEGANRAVIAASKFKEITNLVVLGGGGLKQSEELSILSEYYGGNPENFSKKFSQISNDPENINKFFLGSPYKYWSHVLFFDPIPYYTQLEIPIFIGFGEKDRSVPIESGYFLRDKFIKLGKKNLFFLEIKDCGHNFDDSKGISHLNEIFKSIRNWLHHNESYRPTTYNMASGAYGRGIII